LATMMSRPRRNPLLPIDAARRATWASLVTAALTVAAAVGGVAAGPSIYGEASTSAGLASNDIVTLALAVPFLLASVWVCRAAHPLGLYAWLASLFYLIYNYVPYAIDVPNRAMLGLYVPLLASALLAVFILATSIPATQIPLASARRIGLGIFLLCLAAFVLVYQSVGLVRWFIDDRTDLDTSAGLLVADLALGVPLLVVTGIQSLTAKGLGPVGGASMLLSFGLLSVGLLLLFAVNLITGSSGVQLIDSAVVLIAALACLGAFTIVVRRRIE
jgi:hypothetical protein